MRLFLFCFLVVALSLQVSDVMSFSLRRGVAAFAPITNRRVAVVSSSLRWMSAQEPAVEKTEEEKAAIKAAREARK